MHFNFNDTVAGAGFTPAAFNVKTKPTRFVAPCLRFPRFWKQLPYMVKNLGIGSGVASGGFPNGRLINMDNFIYIFKTFDSFMLTGWFSGTIDSVCYTDKTFQGKKDINIFKIIWICLINNKWFFNTLPSFFRDFNAFFTGQIKTG